MVSNDGSSASASYCGVCCPKADPAAKIDPPPTRTTARQVNDKIDNERIFIPHL